MSDKDKKLDLYWQKLCAEHDVDDYIKNIFNNIKQKGK
tara:strand:+ start:1387 stop:1500 length:114 start_codon:yes stop_codon:yes gene_type:complete